MNVDIKEIKLQVWEEILGDCIELEVNEDQVVVVFRCCQHLQIAFPRDSKEGIILRGLGRKLVGQKLSIFRTDIPTKPIIVRTVSHKSKKIES